MDPEVPVLSTPTPRGGEEEHLVDMECSSHDDPQPIGSIGCLYIERSKWLDLLPDGWENGLEGTANRLKDDWKSLMKDGLRTFITDLPCATNLVFKNSYLRSRRSRKGNSRHWYAWAYCEPAAKADFLRSARCHRFMLEVQHFDFDMDDSFIQVDVHATGKLLEGELGLPWHTRHSKSWHESVKPALLEELKRFSIWKVYNNYVMQHKNDPIAFPYPGPYSSLERMKQAVMSANDNCKSEAGDLAVELEKLHQDNALLLETKHPFFCVGWASTAQMEVLKQVAVNGTAYVDSTGGFIGDTPACREGDAPRKTTYSCMVVKTAAGQHSFPVSEMISSSEDAVTKSTWLQRLRHAWRAGWTGQGSGRLFRTIVSDDSWAFMHAVLQACNQENIVSFLTRCYQAESKGDFDAEDSTDFRARTVLHVCAFHAVRRVQKYAKGNTQGKSKQRVSKLAVNAYRALLRSDSREEAAKIVKLMAIAFGRKSNSPIVKEAIQDLERIQEDHIARMDQERQKRLRDTLLRSTPTDAEVNDSIDTTNPDDPPELFYSNSSDEGNSPEECERDFAVASEPLYKQSPYYHFFTGIIESGTQSPTDNEHGSNECYIANFMEYLATRHLAYLPMMNRTFVKNEVDPVTLLLTNNYVEKWFGAVKTHVFPNMSGVRRARVIRELGTFVNGEIHSHEFPRYKRVRCGARPPTRSKKSSAPAAPPPQRTSNAGRGRRRKCDDTEFLPPVDDPSTESDSWRGYNSLGTRRASTPTTSAPTPPVSGNDYCQQPSKRVRFDVISKEIKVPSSVLQGFEQHQEDTIVVIQYVNQDQMPEAPQEVPQNCPVTPICSQQQQEETSHVIQDVEQDEIQEALQEVLRNCPIAPTSSNNCGGAMELDDNDYHILMDGSEHLTFPISVIGRYSGNLLHYTPPGAAEDASPVLLLRTSDSAETCQSALENFTIDLQAKQELR